MISTDWYWQESDSRDIYAHVFDQNGKKGTTNNIPIRYTNNTISYNTTDNIPQCSDYDGPSNLLEKSKGLYGNNYEKKITNQYSCRSNTLNAGNWYNFPAATAGSNNVSTSTEKDMPNSICPKGWQLPSNSGTKSYQRLIRDVYQIADGPSDSIDSNLLNNSAMLFVRLGVYYSEYGMLGNRGNRGDYWSSFAYGLTNSRGLGFAINRLYPQGPYVRTYGMSIRCISR